MTAPLSLTTIFAAAGFVGAFTGARLVTPARNASAPPLWRLVNVLAIFLLVDNG
ncbi:hypothetical protein [Candidatus Amarolinea dominans]|uniref:hypothetical protein n=1 Tax=Candidatus Amarolinea dominans TaxID=3140696 RepID=UPI0031354330|nr:hypothetical protein [Anaerolineae bacterium]